MVVISVVEAIDEFVGGIGSTSAEKFWNIKLIHYCPRYGHQTKSNPTIHKKFPSHNPIKYLVRYLVKKKVQFYIPPNMTFGLFIIMTI